MVHQTFYGTSSLDTKSNERLSSLMHEPSPCLQMRGWLKHLLPNSLLLGFASLSKFGAVLLTPVPFRVMSSAAAVSTGANAVQASMVAPFTGLKAASSFPVSRKQNLDITSIARNGGRVQCMQVWPPINKKKYETLSYLPDLSVEQLLSEIEYLLKNGWVPCLEFETEHGFVYREHHHSPGYYDGRYWTMWKLPMFGCTDATQVLAEVEEAKKAYPQAWVRIIGFDNVRQVQCISFIAYKPEGY